MSDLDDPGPRPDPTLPPAPVPAAPAADQPAPISPRATEPEAGADDLSRATEPEASADDLSGAQAGAQEPLAPGYAPPAGYAPPGGYAPPAGYAPPGEYPVPPGYDPADYAPAGYPGPGNFGEETSWPPVVAAPPRARREWPIRKADLVWAAVWALVPVVAGLVLAFVWHALGPHVEIVMTAPDQPDLTDYNTEAFVAGDGRYAVLTGIAGIVTGALAWLLRRGRGPLLVIALAAGSLAGAFLTWKLGTHLGEAEYRHLLKTAAAGTHFSQNMQLRAEGLVYLQPLAAVAVFVGCAAWSRYPDLLPAARHEPLPAYPPPPEYSESNS